MKVVLCEGPSDKAILSTLIKRNNLDVTVEAYDGKDNLKNHLELVKTRPHDPKYPNRPTYREITTLAVIRDADENGKGAFTSVRATLENMDFVNLPAQNSEFSGEAPGTRESKRTGIFILGHEGRGAIEDLCLASIDDRPEFSCLDDYFKCRQQAGFAEPGAKARVRVWLVSHPDFEFFTQSVVGEERYWGWDHPAFGSLTKFLMAM